jgi:D-alanine-D-alanine ligase
MKPLAAIVYGRIGESATLDDQDTLVQAAGVGGALQELGWETREVPVTLDLKAAAAELTRLSPAIVFNLAETLEGTGRLITLVPALLDSLGIPFTGAPTDAIFLTSNKLLGKRTLAGAGIPTPAWLEGAALAAAAAGAGPAFPPPYIVKSVWEHASVGLEDAAIAGSAGDLAALLRARAGTAASPAAGPAAAGLAAAGLFAEAYVDGREFNLALLGGTGSPEEPQNLPPAEIQFTGYPAGKPRIVGYSAKWVEGSFEYNNTPRRFDMPASDLPLISRLVEISRACWRLFGLRGYARVDFRVDEAGRPSVLEINTNPCIAPDAGFIAAASQAGLGMKEVVKRIVADTLGKGAP